MRRRLRWIAVLLLLTGSLLVLPASVLGDDDPRPPDRMAEALSRMGISEAELGYRPPAHLARYPHPRTVPYVLPFFEDLLARPLDTYPFVRTYGNTVEDLLTPEKLQQVPTTKDRAETLFKLGVQLATDRRIGGFRGYSANLDPQAADDAPLLEALGQLLARSASIDVAAGSFGQGGPRHSVFSEVLVRQVDGVPEALHAPLARLILNTIEARLWIDRGLRHVTSTQRARLFEIVRELMPNTPDGTRYYPVVEDIARVLDEHSLWYGCLKALQALQDARRELAALRPRALPAFRLDLPTRWGRVVIANAEDQAVVVDDALLAVRFGRGPTRGSVGATAPDRSLSLCLLMDEASAGDIGLPADSDPRADSHRGLEVAAGVLGCGVVYSAGAHDTVYRCSDVGLGAGVFGLGALVDEGGNDAYAAASVAQGAGLFGAGLLLDAAGDDRYDLAEGDGQGFGGPGGIGLLCDRSGADRYRAEPLASKAGRGDYHSEHAVAVSNAQGVGSGRRGDGSDGHSWAGGLGGVIDVDGDDTYIAGNFSQGLGYWYGTGFLYDGGGDDRYESVYFTQGSGAHFAIGALVDESGNDVHELGHNAGAAYGFGWDVVNAFLIDRGAGNDRYEAKIISTGLAEVRSNAFFVDEGGDDTYVLSLKTKGFGDVDTRSSYETPRRHVLFPTLLDQVGLFLDLGGKDTYLRRGKGDVRTPDAAARDGGLWNERKRKPAARHGFNVSLGWDVEGGRIGAWDLWPARRPPTESK